MYVYLHMYFAELHRYHQQQNKWYPHSCLLAHFQATVDFSQSKINDTPKVSEKLQLTAAICNEIWPQ